MASFNTAKYQMAQEAYGWIKELTKLGLSFKNMIPNPMMGKIIKNRDQRDI